MEYISCCQNEFVYVMYEIWFLLVLYMLFCLLSLTEPFDADLWMLVCIVGIQVYSIAIFGFEWLSPLGFNMKVQ